MVFDQKMHHTIANGPISQTTDFALSQEFFRSRRISEQLRTSTRDRSNNIDSNDCNFDGVFDPKDFYQELRECYVLHCTV